jgi:hypothetical protein
VGLGRPAETRWLLDDGVLDTLSQEVGPQVYGQWPSGHLLVAPKTAVDLHGVVRAYPQRPGCGPG